MTLQQRLNLLRLRSGLTQEELATIFSVTRMTLYNWARGRGKLTPVNGSRAEQVSVGLLTAIERGLLPLSKNLTEEQRSTRVVKMRDLLLAHNKQ